MTDCWSQPDSIDSNIINDEISDTPSQTQDTQRNTNNPVSEHDCKHNCNIVNIAIKTPSQTDDQDIPIIPIPASRIPVVMNHLMKAPSAINILHPGALAGTPQGTFVVPTLNTPQFLSALAVPQEPQNSIPKIIQAPSGTYLFVENPN